MRNPPASTLGRLTLRDPVRDFPAVRPSRQVFTSVSRSAHQPPLQRVQGAKTTSINFTTGTPRGSLTIWTMCVFLPRPTCSLLSPSRLSILLIVPVMHSKNPYVNSEGYTTPGCRSRAYSEVFFRPSVGTLSPLGVLVACVGGCRMVRGFVSGYGVLLRRDRRGPGKCIINTIIFPCSRH